MDDNNLIRPIKPKDTDRSTWLGYLGVAMEGFSLTDEEWAEVRPEGFSGPRVLLLAHIRVQPLTSNIRIELPPILFDINCAAALISALTLAAEDCGCGPALQASLDQYAVVSRRAQKAGFTRPEQDGQTGG